MTTNFSYIKRINNKNFCYYFNVCVTEVDE